MEKDMRKIHNYIRDYTKISNEDKSFFIACILISIRKESFCLLLDKYNSTSYIYDLMKGNLMDVGLDISVFEFLRNDENNKHFYNIIQMVRDIYTQNPSSDLLNKFYSEFVSYYNTDGKSLGIVLTPEHVIHVMVRMLDLSSKDVFLDLCTGTGSFPLTASTYNPLKIICVEYQTKLYNLAKCNFILHDLNVELLKGNCFEYKFKASKSAINPPYGKKMNETELEFVLKQLESVSDNGVICAIIPTTCLNNTKYVKLKQKLLEMGTPTHIMNMNGKLFYPTACVNTSIIRIIKRPYKGDNVLFVNYEDDGIEVQKQRGLIRTPSFESKLKRVMRICDEFIESDISVLCKNIQADTDWNYHHYNRNVVFDTTYADIAEKILSVKIAEARLSMVHSVIHIKNPRIYYLRELFTIESVRRVTKKYAEDNAGRIPYISASELNNGITTFTSISNVNGYCLTLANSGSVGACFYHSYDICATDSVFILRLRNPFQEWMFNRVVMCHLAVLIEKNRVKYNFGRACRLNKIVNDYIQLPSDDRGFPMFESLGVMNE
jgi:predicted RNA methylase